MSFTTPNLAEMVSKYKAFLAPEDPRFGEGISGWDITSEYDDNPMSESNSAPIWGCMCSPSTLASEGKRIKLQPADIEAKRAHIVVRTPKNQDDLLEVERTVMHELGHVLHAKLNLPRDLEEEIMHSLDHFFSKLSPEQGQMLARSFSDPMARAYRAKDKAMPDPIEEKKDPDKEAPKMAEGAMRDVATIEMDLAKAAMAKQPLEALAEELALALIAKGASGGSEGPASAAIPEAPPVMGMKPEEAYARAKREEGKKAVKALVDNLPGLDDKQKKYLHGRSSIDEVNEALEAMPRAQGAKVIELAEDPRNKKGKQPETPFERMRKAPEDPMVREAVGLGSGSVGSHGISQAAAHCIVFSLKEQAVDNVARNREMKAKVAQ